MVEAKAHIGEIKSSCGASESGGLPMIRSAFEVTKRNMAIDQSNDWLRPFYQYANRRSGYRGVSYSSLAR